MESADLFGGKPAESILWNRFKYGRMGRRFIGSYAELKVTIQILLNKHKRWEMLCVINNPILWKFAELSMDCWQ